MQPEIIKKDQIYLAGMSFYGDPFDTSNAWTEENQIGRLWQRFMDYLKSQGPHLSSHFIPGASYELHLYGPETEETGVFEVFVGLGMKNLAYLPLDLVGKVLPAATYAVFTLQGRAIMTDWDREIADWLEGSDYQDAYPFNFQYYDARFVGLDRIEDSTLDVYLPIEKKP
jgi:predicted transcriptional regulator YdeE